MIIHQKFVNREDLQANPKILYLFGDNTIRRGYGGQAGSMRGEPNAIGVRTKNLPNNTAKAFFSDANYDNNCDMIDADLVPVWAHLKAGGHVVIPLDGLGTGLSDLPNKAPDTNEFLVGRLKQMCEDYG
jgi:hypothetical protein